ncbi:MAG TPA: leucine--tRNA ligase [Candidatus Eremiobacteraceae bacterium]|nr:leucine--tRNA ligase [Candidatus Eremiobacteraceae bacterium]
MPHADIPSYDPQAVETKWQRLWAERHQNEVVEDPAKPKYYLLEMLPYPSGDLHVGHARNYTLGDVVARYERMRGLNVMHPMGWDAFGLPAENAAIARGVHPRIWTSENIANMRRQLQRLGVAYDWTREIDTSSPEYYRWTQWLFLLMFRRGLAYKKEAPVNWCPRDKTVLANEQVENGVCWRCGTKVERRLLNQWFLKITAYADALLTGLDSLGWPERIKTVQRNWIGRSEGFSFSFQIENAPDARIEVFTTRLDTLFGATFLALAPEHPAVETLSANTPQNGAVKAFAAEMRDISELDRAQLLEKRGVFSGGYVIHPLANVRIPVWVTNYVLATYGSGAVMGVPAHDERDLEFARQYGIEIKPVVVPQAGAEARVGDCAVVDDGVLVNSDGFDGLTSARARERIGEALSAAGNGSSAVLYKLRDWLISRQRYWGAPIPFVDCAKDGLVPVPEDRLPVLLPDDVPFAPESGSPLENAKGWREVQCPRCGGPALREAETMDTFMCSSWYYMRYLSPHDANAPWSVEAAKYWAPVDRYIGGAEHAVLHLMYARFFYKVLQEEGLVPGDEPFLRLFNQGLVLGANNERMSKSRGNVVGIDETVERYGADALRIFEMFAGPPESDFPWSTAGISGATRTLVRIWRLVLAQPGCCAGKPSDALRNGAEDRDLRYSIHSKIKQISEELGDRMHLNTCVAALMTLLNDLEAAAGKPNDVAALREGCRALVLMLAPFAPHITEELWERSGGAGSVHLQPWPTFDTAALRRDVIPIVVQVNGKRRAAISVEPGCTEDAAMALALRESTVSAQLDGKEIVKRIFVPDRLLNIVAR